MTAKFIAITTKGCEYIFSKTIMLAVPTNSAQAIADALNKANYKLKDGQTWWVYDNDYYYNQCITGEIKSFSKKRQSIRVYTYNR